MMDENVDQKQSPIPNGPPSFAHETRPSEEGPNLECEVSAAAAPSFQEDHVAWLQVCGAFCLNLNTWGLMNAYGVYQTYYELDISNAQSSFTISWIGSTQAFLMFLTSIVVGPIFDTGYLRSLLWSGTLLTVVGMFLTSICKTYWQSLLSQGVMVGFGFGLLYLPAPAIVSQYFNARKALAMGISSAGSAIGGVIYPIIFSQLEPRVGFGWATRVLSFIILGTSLPPLALMKTRTRPTKRRNLVDATAFKDTPYILLNFGLLFGFMGIYIIFYYIELYALLEASVATTLTSYILVIINASSLLGRLILGFYADKMGSINVQTIVAFATALLTFCLIAIKNPPGLIVYSVLYGFFAGAFMGLPAAGVARLSADHSKIGTRLGMTLAFVGFGVLVSNPIAGAILGYDRDWIGLIVWCGTLLAMSGASMAASRIVKAGFGFSTVI